MLPALQIHWEISPNALCCQISMKGRLKSVPIVYRILHFFLAQPLPISQMEDQTSHFNNSH